MFRWRDRCDMTLFNKEECVAQLLNFYVKVIIFLKCCFKCACIVWIKNYKQTIYCVIRRHSVIKTVPLLLCLIQYIQYFTGEKLIDSWSIWSKGLYLPNWYPPAHVQCHCLGMGCICSVGYQTGDGLYLFSWI